MSESQTNIIEVPYFKIEGAGNLCAVVDKEVLARIPEAERPHFIRLFARKKTGIDVDQVLEVENKNPLSFFIWNSDGSKAAMCGNGARAILRLAEEKNWISHSPPQVGSNVPLQIDSRQYSATRLSEKGSYGVNLGIPRVLGKEEIFVDNNSIVYWRVMVGNPHAVVFCGYLDGDWVIPTNFSLAFWGDKLEKALGANIEFVQNIPQQRSDVPEQIHLNALVWELGAGATQACGSGAVAIAVAHQQRNQSLKSDYVIDMPGGRLQVDLKPEGAVLSGASSILGEGTYTYTISGVS